MLRLAPYIAVALAFAAVLGWALFERGNAAVAAGERNVAIEQKNVALAEKQVAIDDRNRAVDANKKLVADMTYLQEQRRREGVLITQLMSENDKISKEADELEAAIAEAGKNDESSDLYLRTRIPGALLERLRLGPKAGSPAKSGNGN